MGEQEPSASVEQMNDGTYPMYFGVTCAFVALQLVPSTSRLDLERAQRRRIGEFMLQGSAQLLGLLVRRVQRREEALEEKLRKAELEVDELKQRRIEDAKANEKVVSIFAAHEQSWIAERKRFRHQIQALVTEMRILKANNEETVMDLRKRTEEEEERAIRMKDEALEEEARKRRELEERLQLAEEATEELKERTEKEAQEHSAELWKHKTAFVELVSNQRQLEAEIGRALRQAEAAKQELEEVFERKEEALAMVEKLSGEIMKLHKDSEQKDKILSAMLRKSKLDTAQKQMLLKEVKISKAKKKQAEMEVGRWKKMWESRHKKGSRETHSLEAGCSQNWRPELQLENSGHNSKTLLLEYLEAESRKERDSSSAKGESVITTVECLDWYSSDGNDVPGSDDFERLQDWVRLETEKYATVLEQKYYTEIEAFTEQLRVKDEKLESFRWQVLSMELESKRLQSHMEGLDGNLSRVKEENLKLEALLLDKEKELKLLKEQIRHLVQHCQKNNSHHFSSSEYAKKSSASSGTCDPQALQSEVKITKRKPREKDQESNTSLVRDTQKAGSLARVMDGQNVSEAAKLMHKIRALTYRESTPTDTTALSPTNTAPPTDNVEGNAIICVKEMPFLEPKRMESVSRDKAESITPTSQSPKDEIEEEKEVSMDPGNAHLTKSFKEGADIDNRFSSAGPSVVQKDSSWRRDIHALGVSYKIKRLKQQVLVLEKLTEPQATEQLTTKDDASNDSADENKQQEKEFMMMISLLNKQLKRYQSLEEKTDNLCHIIHENYRSGVSRNSQTGKTKAQTEALEHFLEEAFQLQRYMVATGQKLMDLQFKISSCCGSGSKLGESVGFNMRLFTDIVRTLFQEIQRGLEVRVARIIGDLEGTLASDGILHR